MDGRSFKAGYGLLIVLFGLSSWLGPDALFVELGIHTQLSPEGWALGSIVIVVNMAGLFGLLVSFIMVRHDGTVKFTRMLRTNCVTTRLNFHPRQIASLTALLYIYLEHFTAVRLRTRPLILAGLVLVCAATVPLAFWSERSVQVGGRERSVLLLACSFVLAAVSTTSDVLFMPFMKNVPAQYFQAYFVGVGMGALVPSLISIVQGSSRYECVWVDGHLQPMFTHLRLSVTAYYLLILLFYMLGLLSFVIVAWRPALFHKFYPDQSALAESIASDERTTDNLMERSANNRRDVLLLSMMAFTTMIMFALVPSLLSYATLAYSQSTYFWSLILGSVFQPLGAFTTYLISVRRTRALLALFALLSTFAVFFLALSLQSPNPLMVGTIGGSLLAVSLTVLINYLGSFLRSELVECYRLGSEPGAEEKRLAVVGLWGQIGNFIAALLIFPAVNVWNVFESAPPC